MDDTRSEPHAVERDCRAELAELYRRRGSSRYDEVVSQTEHALQCGALAMAFGADAPTIVAALLHDVGHLITRQRAESARRLDRRHEQVGAHYLATWFPEDVTDPVRLHVPAKRFLCATDPSYVDRLSAASIRSLELQGGPMTPEECDRFDSLPHSTAAVRLRRWDDAAKEAGAPTPTFDAFDEIVAEALHLG